LGPGALALVGVHGLSKPTSFVILGLATLVAFIATGGGAHGATIIPGGTIASDTTWDLAGSPYYVAGTVTVDAATTLNIDAGVAVLFDGNFSIIANGDLIVAGNETDPVLFDANGTGITWGGLEIASQLTGSRLENLSVLNANIGFWVRGAPRNTVASDLRVEGAHLVGVLVSGTGSNGFYYNITVANSASGFEVHNSTNVRVTGYWAWNLTHPAAFGILSRLSMTIRFSYADVQEGRIEASAGSRVTLVNVTVYSTAFDEVMAFRNSPQGTVTNATILGGKKTGLHMESSSTFRGGFMFIGPYNTTAPNDGIRGFQGLSVNINNTTITGTRTGINFTLVAPFQFDNVTVEGATEVGLSVRDGGLGSRARNFAANNVSLGFRVEGTGNRLDIDFSLGVTVNQAPVLGLYNVIGLVIPAAQAFGWVYAWNSPTADIRGLNIPVWGGDPAVMWAYSVDGFIGYSAVRGSRMGMRIVDSNITRIESSSFISPTDAVRAESVMDLRITNSTLTSVMGPAYSGLNTNLVRMVNVTFTSSVMGATESGSDMSYYELSTFDAPVAFQSFDGDLLQLQRNWLCGGPLGTAVQLVINRDAVVDSNTFCQRGKGVVLEGGNANIIVNSNFINMSIGVWFNGSVSSTVTRCEFRGATQYGVLVTAGFQNTIVENAFYNNAESGYDSAAPANFWYGAAQVHGNYWDTYLGSDSDDNSIGDTPFNIAGGTKQDIYPLMAPFELEPPTAFATVPSSTDEDVAVLLVGAGSVDNQKIMRGVWTIRDDGGDVVLDGINVTHTFATPGTFVCILDVFDRWGNTAQAFAFITVRDKTAPNLPSSVPPFNLLEDEVSGLAVLASDNDPRFPFGAQFQWRFSGGWAQINLSLPTSVPALFVNFTEAGSYAGSLTVTDAGGNVAALNFVVNVADRTAPSFSFLVTGEVPPDENATVVFEMRFAFDNDPSFPGPSSLEWVMILPNLTTIHANGPVFNFTVPVPGNYSLYYEARDAAGNVKFGNYEWTARDSHGPIWTPPETMGVAEGDSLTLDASSATDNSGVAGATWFDGATPLGPGLTIDHTFIGLGTHIMTVILSDLAGYNSTYRFDVIVVDQTDPALKNDTFLRTRTVRQLTAFELDAAGAFTDNDPTFAQTARYLWAVSGGAYSWGSPDNQALLRLLFNDTATYTIQLTAFDQAGNFVVVTTLVNVTDGLPPTSVSYTVAPNLTIDLGKEFTFTASAQDPGGVFFAWTFGDGEIGEGPIVGHEYAATGRYQVVVTVSDAAGNQVVVRFNVTVREAGLGGGGQPGGGGPPGGGSGNNGTAGMTMNDLIMISGVALAAGIAGIYAVFRRKLKKPQQKPDIVEPAPALMPWEKPQGPPQTAEDLYADDYRPYQPPPPQ
jgi:nitrous oxidase accessory protein NosD